MENITEGDVLKREKRRFFYFYEISNFSFVNYMKNYKADEKKDILANAHLTLNLVFSFVNVNRVSLCTNENPIFAFFNPPYGSSVQCSYHPNLTIIFDPFHPNTTRLSFFH